MRRFQTRIPSADARRQSAAHITVVVDCRDPIENGTTGTSSGNTVSRNNLWGNTLGSILDSGTGNTIS